MKPELVRERNFVCSPILTPQRFSLIALLSLLVSVCGCVPNKPYRIASPVSNSTDVFAPSIVERSTSDDPAKANYDLAYIEFDDMGEYWTIGRLGGSGANDSQVEGAVRLIERREKEKPVVVIAFIHGWKNNASPYDEQHAKNLMGFKAQLHQLASADLSHAYVGVFLSWRGQIIPGDIFASYWDRRGAARRVGGPSMTEALFRLMFVTKPPVPPTQENRCGSPNSLLPTPHGGSSAVTPSEGTQAAEEANSLPSPPKKADLSPEMHSALETARASLYKTNNLFIVIGHSFGARVLERAISQPIMTLLYERRSEADSCRKRWNRDHVKSEHLGILTFDRPADLIVTINAANDAFEAKAMIEGMVRMNLRACVEYACVGKGGYFDSPPLIISMLSEGDWVTRKLMPIAQALSYPAQSLNHKYDQQGSQEGQITGVKQKKFFFNNEGSIKELISHTIIDCSKRETQCGQPNAIAFSNAGFSFELAPLAADGGGERHFLNRTPFWVFSVPPSIIPDHSDFFKPGVADLLQAILMKTISPTQSMTAN